MKLFPSYSSFTLPVFHSWSFLFISILMSVSVALLLLFKLLQIMWDSWTQRHGFPPDHKISHRILRLIYLLTYSIDQSPSWESNRFSASKKTPRILWNPKVHYCIYTCPRILRFLALGQCECRVSRRGQTSVDHMNFTWAACYCYTVLAFMFVQDTNVVAGKFKFIFSSSFDSGNLISLLFSISRYWRCCLICLHSLSIVILCVLMPRKAIFLSFSTGLLSIS